jgi:hypothetical protein
MTSSSFSLNPVKYATCVLLLACRGAPDRTPGCKPDKVRIELAGPRPLLQRELRIHHPEDTGTLVLDTRQLSFVSPLELTGLVASAHVAAQAGKIVEVMLPDDWKVTAYLERMDVIKRLEGHAFLAGTPPEALRFDRATVLIEVTHVSALNAEEFTTRLGRMIHAHLDPTLRKAAFVGVGELIDNATTHGGSPTGAFAAAQLYSGTTSGYAGMEFAICDTGVGVLSHLRGNADHHHLRSAPAALAHALKPGVTGTAEPRGYGLHDLLSTNDGYVRLIMRSGNGFASVVARPGGGARRHDVAFADPVPGTWAWLRVRNP